MLVKNGGIPKDDGCIQQVLEYFVLYGFCIVKKRNQKSVVTVVGYLPLKLHWLSYILYFA